MAADTVSRRFRRAAAKTGVSASLPDLRRYSAARLVAAGVDSRTVARRLGWSQAAVTAGTVPGPAAHDRAADRRAAGILARELGDPRDASA